MFFCYFIWRIVINLLSLQRQNESSGYPGRIPRGQDYIDTTHLKEPRKGSFYFKYRFKIPGGTGAWGFPCSLGDRHLGMFGQVLS